MAWLEMSRTIHCDGSSLFILTSGKKKNQGEQSGRFILNRVGMVLTAQLSANGLEFTESHCLPGTNKF